MMGLPFIDYIIIAHIALKTAYTITPTSAKADLAGERHVDGDAVRRVGCRIG